MENNGATSFSMPYTARDQLTNLDFADDIALLANNFPTLQETSTKIEKEVVKPELRISGQNTEVMLVGKRVESEPMKVDKNQLKKFQASHI